MSGTVADVMTTAPIVVEVPGSRSDAINIMVRNGLTGLPVIRASDGKLMGVVSRRDVFRNFEEDQLSLIMKKGCITVTPETTVEEAAAIFKKDLTIRGGGVLLYPLENDAKPGVYKVSVRLTNPGYSHVLRDAMTIIVE